MSAYFLVAVGGAAGSILRFAAGQCLATGQQLGFPWSTLAVNLVGSFLAGVLIAAGMNQNHEKMWQLAANVLANLAGGLLACAAGWGVGKWLDEVFWT